MTESPILDRFTAFDRVRGHEPLPFKLDGDREPRPDIPQWQINRTNARSAGRKTFTHTNPCRSWRLTALNSQGLCGYENQ